MGVLEYGLVFRKIENSIAHSFTYVGILIL